MKEKNQNNKTTTTICYHKSELQKGDVSNSNPDDGVKLTDSSFQNPS